MWASEMMTNSSDGSKFLPLKDALCYIGQRVNLLVVVVEIGIPRKSKGTDYYCTLKVVDESYQDPTIAVNFFAPKVEELPCVKEAGDLIQLCSVEIKSHDSKVFVSFKKRVSSFALFNGKSSQDLNPYHLSSNFQLRVQDNKFISHLRQWLLNFQLDAGRSDYLLPLKEIKEGKPFDLICKIVYADKVSENSWMLFVWDGTDTPPLSIQSKLEDEFTDPLLLQVETSSLSTNVLSTFPWAGSILRVELDRACEYYDLNVLGSGQWVRLRNLTCQEHSHSGLWKGVLTSFSKIHRLSSEDGVVEKCLRNHTERILSKRDRLRRSSFPHPSPMAVTDEKCAPRLTLIQLLMETKVPSSFKCVVRVLAMCPWRVEDFRSPIGTQPYRIRFTLEDPTARIHAYLYGEHGVKFFQGYPSVEVLKKKRNDLLGVAAKENGEEDLTIPRNPPWIKCCIFSYYPDNSGILGSRQFRIFGTTLLASDHFVSE